MRTNPILVVDDDDALRAVLVEALEALPVEITVAASSASGGDRDACPTDASPSSLPTSKMKDSGRLRRACTKAKDSYPNCRVVMLTGHGGREVAVQAMEQGATYYVEKPVDLKPTCAPRCKKSLEDHDKDVAYDDLKGQIERAYGIEGIIGQDPKMQRTLSLVRQIASTAASVLILGPSGTGKELIARAVHNLSPRKPRDRSSRSTAAGSVRRHDRESELFGHIKGAFTGAVADREGKFEYANGGTLLLDEVGEMPLPDADQAAARARRARRSTRLGDNKRAAGRRAGAGGDQRRSAAEGAGRFVPPGPLLPTQGRHHRPAGVEGPSRRHQAAGRTTSSSHFSQAARQGRRVDRPGRAGRAGAIRLAGQRARVAQRRSSRWSCAPRATS